MRAIMESAFSVAYLITVITLGIMLFVKSNGDSEKRLFCFTYRLYYGRTPSQSSAF